MQKKAENGDQEIPRQIRNPDMYSAPMAIRKIVDDYHLINERLLDHRKNINLMSSGNVDINELNKLTFNIIEEQRQCLAQFKDKCFIHFQEFIKSDQTFTRFNDTFIRGYQELGTILDASSSELMLNKESIDKDLAFYKSEEKPNTSIMVGNPNYKRINIREKAIEILKPNMDQEQVQQQQSVRQVITYETVPDVVTDYKTIFVTKNQLTIRFLKPDDNGSEIDQYKLCLEEQDKDVILSKQREIQIIKVQDPQQQSYQFDMNFADINGIDFGNKIFPLNKMINIIVLAHNKHGWSINFKNHSMPVCLHRFTSTSLYLKGSLKWGLFPENCFDQSQINHSIGQAQLDYSDENSDAQSILCQTSYSRCLLEIEQVRDICIKHSALLLNEQSNVCQWGEILAFESENNSQVVVEQADFCTVLPYNLNIPEPIYKVACGQYHSFCITVQGLIYGWGKNDKGQLGIGSVESQTVPVLLPFFKDQNIFIDDIRVGNAATICKSKNGQLFTWGERQFYIFGDQQAQAVKNDYGNTVNYQCRDKDFFINIPKQITGLKVQQITSGYYHFGALSESGELYVWGDNDHFCLGVNEYCNQEIQNFVMPYQLDLQLTERSKIQEIAFGAYHCLVRVRQNNHDIVLSWGCNDMGQCGRGEVSDICSIGMVLGLPKQFIKQIDGGTNHSLFLTNDKLFGCGGNECYQLDQIEMTVFQKAVEVECLPNIQKIQAGHMVSALLIR